MSFTIFLQVLANVVFAVGLFVIFARLRRPAKDDPRLSKGLQLLSSKIAVLEDLSDRTETQVQQMLALLDQKSKELQSKIALADQQVSAIRQSMDQSLQVAQIFQDKIPHNEIIERQNSMKYIRAARMAHAGVSVTDIAREVDLPMGEIEFIAKVNRENLSFREEDLPAWARDPNAMSPSNVEHLSLAASVTPAVQEHMPVPAGVTDTPSNAAGTAPLSAEHEGLVQKLSKLQFEMQNLDLELAHRSARSLTPDFTHAFETPKVDSSSLEKLGEQFRRAVEQAETAESARGPVAQSSPGMIAPKHQADLHWPTTTAAGAVVPAVAQSPKPETKTIERQVSNPELEAARAAAAALRAKDAAPAPPTKTIRRVEFPRI